MLETHSKDNTSYYYKALFNIKGEAAQVLIQISLIRCYLILINLSFLIYKMGLN